MIIGLGSDLCNIERIQNSLDRFGERFDHNLHSLRIVESFEQPYACFPGLNLTFEVREGIVKHSRDITPGESPELDEYLPGQRPPLEAQLIDLADEIAYNTADLDDAFSADTVDEIVARLARHGTGDFVSDAARELPYRHWGHPRQLRRGRSVFSPDGVGSSRPNPPRGERRRRSVGGRLDEECVFTYYVISTLFRHYE